MSVLEVKSVSKSFGDEKIIEDISLQLKAGEIVSLLGVSGVGKTTLFNVIAGLSAPDCGSVFVGDEDVTAKPGKISYMLQKDLLLPYRTIIDNVALPLVVRGMKKAQAREYANSFFSRFGLDGTQKKYPSQISGGMKQRAALLRTYLFSESVALFDEPFSALDMFTKNEMHSWFSDIMRDIKLSAIFITHDIDEAILLSDRIYLLSGKPGRIVDTIRIERKDGDFRLSDEFINYKRRIISSLESE